MASKTVEKRPKAEVNAIDPADEPSVGWGWHGAFPRAAQVAGWVSVALIVVMLITLSPQMIAATWLTVLAVGMAVGLLMDIRRRKLSWRH